jgi:hypothetical protein
LKHSEKFRYGVCADFPWNEKLSNEFYDGGFELDSSDENSWVYSEYHVKFNDKIYSFYNMIFNVLARQMNQIFLNETRKRKLETI